MIYGCRWSPISTLAIWSPSVPRSSSVTFLSILLITHLTCYIQLNVSSFWFQAMHAFISNYTPSCRVQKQKTVHGTTNLTRVSFSIKQHLLFSSSPSTYCQTPHRLHYFTGHGIVTMENSSDWKFGIVQTPLMDLSDVGYRPRYYSLLVAAICIALVSFYQYTKARKLHVSRKTITLSII